MGVGTSAQRAMAQAQEVAVGSFLIELDDADMRAHVGSLLERLLTDELALEHLLAVALEDARLDEQVIRARAHVMGLDSGTLPVELEVLVGGLSRHLTEAVWKLVGRDTAGLYAVATARTLRHLKEQHRRQEALLNRLTEGLLALPSAPEAGIRRFLEDYVGTAERPVPFGGRAAELADLERWTRNTPSGFALVTAPAGGGKSSLLAQLAVALAEEPRIDLVFVPISIRYGTGLANDVFGTVAGRLAVIHDRPTLEAVTSPLVSWRRTAAQLLAAAPVAGRRIVVILDGLDEAVDWEPGPDMFPAELPDGVHVIVSARERPDDAAGQQWIQLVWGPASAEVHALRLPLLTADGIRDALTGPLAGRMSPDAIRELVDVLFGLSAGDPVVTRLYVDDLVAQLDAGVGPDLEALASRPPGLEAYFEGLREDQQRLWRGQGQSPLLDRAAQSLLCILACARGPLLRNEIVDEVGDDDLTSVALDAILPTLRRLVVGDSDRAGYVLSHPRLGEHLRLRMTARERASYGQRFLTWGRRTLVALDADPGREVSTYLLAYFFSHLYESTDDPIARDAACRAALTRAWRDAARRQTGSDELFSADLAVARRSAEEAARVQGAAGVPATALSSVARCTLLESSLASVADRLPSKVLLALVEYRVWTAEQGLAYVRWMRDEGPRAAMLAGLAPLLEPALARDALLVAHVIDDVTWRARTTAALALRLQEVERPAIMGSAFAAAVAAQAPRVRAEALAGLLPALSGDRLLAARDTVVATVAEIDDWHERGIILLAACADLGDAQSEALARWLQSGEQRSRRTLNPGDALAWARLLHVASSVRDAVPPDATKQLVQQFRRVANAAVTPLEHEAVGRALLSAAALSGGALRKQLTSDAYRRSRRHALSGTRERFNGRSIALGLLDEPGAAIDELLDDLEEHVPVGAVANLLEEIAPRALPRHIPRITDVARDLPTGTGHGRVLAALSAIAADEAERRSLLHEALAASSRLDDNEYRDGVIAALTLAAIASGERDQATRMAETLRQPEARSQVLAAFGDGEAALRAMATLDGWERAPALLTLVGGGSVAAARARWLLVEDLPSMERSGEQWAIEIADAVARAPRVWLPEVAEALEESEPHLAAIVTAVAEARRAHGVGWSPAPFGGPGILEPAAELLDRLRREAILRQLAHPMDAGAQDRRLSWPTDLGKASWDALTVGLAELVVGSASSRGRDDALGEADPDEIERLLASHLPCADVTVTAAVLDLFQDRIGAEQAERHLRDIWPRVQAELGWVRVIPSTAPQPLLRLALTATVLLMLEEDMVNGVGDHRAVRSRFVRRARTAPHAYVVEALLVLLTGLPVKARGAALDVLRELGPAIEVVAGVETLEALAAAVVEATDWWP